MGMDMVGYMVFGPRRLEVASSGDSGATMDTLRRKLMGVRKDIASMTEGEMPDDTDLDFSDEWLDAFEMEEEGIIPDKIPSIFHPSDVEVTDDEILKEVGRLNELWERATCARDAMSRHMGDRVVISAGEATWGDEPEGTGYEALKDLVGHPFSEPLGIE